MAPARSQVKPRNPSFFRGICAIVRRVWSTVFALVMVACWASSATAFADKLALSAGAGYAAWPGVATPHGVALDLQVGVGLSQAWQLRAGGGTAFHISGDDTLHTATARAELVYLIDIVEIVPFAGLGVSGIAAFRDGEGELEPAVHFVGGAAYWLSFDWLLELDVRAHFMPGEVQREPLYLVSTLSVVLTLDR